MRLQRMLLWSTAARPISPSVVLLAVIPSAAVGVAGAPRPRLRLALLQIGAQLLGQPRLAAMFCCSALSAMSLSMRSCGPAHDDTLPCREDYASHCGCPHRRLLQDLRQICHTCACAGRIDMAEGAAFASCGSSVVEHSLGKGEVESSILSRSTSLPPLKSLKPRLARQ